MKDNIEGNIQEKDSFNKSFIYLSSAVAGLGGLLFGFDIAIISGTIRFFADFFTLNDLETGWAVGSISIGAGIGAVISGKLSDVFGRKRLLFLSAFLFALTGLGTGWAPNFFTFIFFRILSGIAVGSVALVCPMYIAEISPSFIRGRLISFYQLSITLGVLIAYFTNYLLLETGENNWRWMFSSQSLPALLFLIFLFFVPESPRWLVMVGKVTEAKKVMLRSGNKFSANEISSIKKSFKADEKINLHSLFDKKMLKLLIIGIVVAFFSQTGGPLISYAPEILGKAGMNEDAAFFQSILIGLTLFFFTFIALFTVDTLGRKKLLLLGALLLCVDTLSLALAIKLNMGPLLQLVLIISFIAIYAASIGPVTWVLLSEIFPNQLRGLGMSVATLSLWVSNFLLLGSFPVFKSQLGMSFTFAIYSGMFLFYFIYLKIFIPETKNKSLEEIQATFVK
ncbi:MAG: sugar porter family MFS transporter [Cyclobacteriaceae bacterium]